MSWAEFGSLVLFLASVYVVFFVWIPNIDAKKKADKAAANMVDSSRDGRTSKPAEKQK